MPDEELPERNAEGCQLGPDDVVRHFAIRQEELLAIAKNNGARPQEQECLDAACRELEKKAANQPFESEDDLASAAIARVEWRARDVARRRKNLERKLDDPTLQPRVRGVEDALLLTKLDEELSQLPEEDARLVLSDNTAEEARDRGESYSKTKRKRDGLLEQLREKLERWHGIPPLLPRSRTAVATAVGAIAVAAFFWFRACNSDEGQSQNDATTGMMPTDAPLPTASPSSTFKSAPPHKALLRPQPTPVRRRTIRRRDEPPPSFDASIKTDEQRALERRGVDTFREHAVSSQDDNEVLEDAHWQCATRIDASGAVDHWTMMNSCLVVDGEWWRVCMGAWDKWTERVLGDLNGALLYVSFESKGPSARAWRQNAEVLALESGFKRPSVVRLDLFSTSSEDAVPIELLDEGSEASEYVVVPGHKEGARERMLLRCVTPWHALEVGCGHRSGISDLRVTATVVYSSKVPYPRERHMLPPSLDFEVECPPAAP